LTIEIDDAGTGDIIGDAFIVFWRRETNDLLVKKIPLELYQSPDFDSKTKSYTKSLFMEAISEMNIPPTEEIFLCTGSIFDEARKYLQEEHFNVSDAKIEGYLQNVIEKTYLDHVINEYGVPEEDIPVESGKDRFFALYNWITDDFPRRNIYVKSGFEKWGTKWEIAAKEDWMRKMVQTDISEMSDDEDPNSEKSPRPKSSLRPQKRQTRPPGRKQTHKRTSSAHPPRSHQVSSRYDRGRGDPQKKRGGPHSSSRDQKKPYSSTDPNPRKFLY
jgi:hypothetical protein